MTTETTDTTVTTRTTGMKIQPVALCDANVFLRKEGRDFVTFLILYLGWIIKVPSAINGELVRQRSDKRPGKGNLAKMARVGLDFIDSWKESGKIFLSDKNTDNYIRRNYFHRFETSLGNDRWMLATIAYLKDYYLGIPIYGLSLDIDLTWPLNKMSSLLKITDIPSNIGKDLFRSLLNIASCRKQTKMILLCQVTIDQQAIHKLVNKKKRPEGKSNSVSPPTVPASSDSSLINEVHASSSRTHRSRRGGKRTRRNT
jgi:hypothetical protein